MLSWCHMMVSRFIFFRFMPYFPGHFYIILHSPATNLFETICIMHCYAQMHLNALITNRCGISCTKYWFYSVLNMFESAESKWINLYACRCCGPGFSRTRNIILKWWRKKKNPYTCTLCYMLSFTQPESESPEHEEFEACNCTCIRFDL